MLITLQETPALRLHPDDDVAVALMPLHAGRQINVAGPIGSAEQRHHCGPHDRVARGGAGPAGAPLRADYRFCDAPDRARRSCPHARILPWAT